MRHTKEPATTSMRGSPDRLIDHKLTQIGTFTGLRGLLRFPSETSKHCLETSCGCKCTDLFSTYPIKDDFLRATESQGIPFVDDLEDLSTGHGAEHWLKWINRDVRANN